MEELKRLISMALKEDNVEKDITTAPIIPREKVVVAKLFAKADGVICGLELFKDIFKILDKRCKFKMLTSDGKKVRKGQLILEIKGLAWAVLAGERTALNFIGHLSGVATLTSKFAKELIGTKAKIYDTRKTFPGLRELEKYAVRCGGGFNHRMNLGDMALIKDNHLALIESISEAVKKIKRAKPNIKIEVECENLKQVQEALDSNCDIIMLDNMDVKKLKDAILIVRNNSSRLKRPEIEISGCVNLQNIRQYAKLGVDRISIGALTHSAPSLDLSLKIV